MAVAPLQLPGYAQPQSLDFSPLANLGQVYKQAQADTNRQTTLAQLGQGGTIDPKVLIGSGDLTLANLGIQLQNRQQDQERQARLDQRQAKNDDFSHNIQTQQLAIQRQNAARLSASPLDGASDRAKVAAAYGLDPQSPQGKAFIISGKLSDADLSVGQAVDQRVQAASRIGLDPSSPGYQSFVLTGKMPREDAQPLTATDKRAILEADEHVQSTQQSIDNLKQAKDLSKRAFSGPGATQGGYIGSLFGNDSATATTDLNNLVTSNALTQLKATFGGNPTEGERAILLQIQGSANMPDAVRQKIYDRGIAMAEKRLKFNQQRVDALRGGSFYKAQVNQQQAPKDHSQGITQQEYESLPSGSVFTAPDGSQRIKP